MTLFAESGETYADFRGVQLMGTARLIDDPAHVLQVFSAIEARNRVGDPPDPETFAAAALKRTAILIDVERTISWDHGKLGGVH